MGLAGVTVIGATVVGALLLHPPVPVLFAAQSFVLLVVVVVVAVRGYPEVRPERERVRERLVVFVSLIVTAGALALAYEQLFADASFDTAHIRLKEGATVDGGYITTTDTAMLLITRGRDDCPAVTAVRRDEIEQVWILPTKLGVEAEQGQPCQATRAWSDLPADNRRPPSRARRAWQ